MERKFDYESFKAFIGTSLPKYKGDPELLYFLFSEAIAAIPQIGVQNSLIRSFGYSPGLVIYYIVGEHTFYLETHPEVREESLRGNKEYASFIVSYALDKYYTNEHLSYSEGSLISPYQPEASTLFLYFNFILSTLSRFKKGDPKETLFVDILAKGFSMARCILNLLALGYETEAFSTWRTLHENECILLTLIGGGETAAQSYIRHLHYAIAFRNGLGSKEETDAAFLEIKEGMRKYGLKSKDMKRFIEYGWLFDVPGASEKEGFKLNFRDGVERAAGLHDYSKVYEMSSEIAHSSPLLIYSRKSYFLLVSLINLYESFFRLEKVFSSIYIGLGGEGERKRYEALRGRYFGEIVASYEKAKRKMAALPKRERKEIPNKPE